MPVAHVHVTGSTPEQRREIGAEVTRIYAEVLEAPLERVRVFVMDHDPGDVTVAGVNLDEGGLPAPFFTAIVFESRPVEQRHRLLREVSEMLARVLDVDLAGGAGPGRPGRPRRLGNRRRSCCSRPRRRDRGAPEGSRPALLTSIVDMVHSPSCIEIRYVADRGDGHEQHATHRPAGLRPR